MSDILEAVKELIEFGFGWLLDGSKDETKNTNKEVAAVPLALNSPVSDRALVLPQSLVTSPDVIIGAKGYEDAYTTKSVRVWQRPVLTLDGEVEHLPYATRVEVFGYEGRFAHVRHQGLTGWILKDELSSSLTEVFPQFNTGEIYSANHPETKKLRKLEQDEFATAELFLPLLDIEFVGYTLKHSGKVLPWDKQRPRLSGLWQNLLKGKPTVQISINPKTGSVMEFVREDGTGFVGYVSSVAVDEGVTISGVGRLIAGEYREEFIAKKVWQEWRPVFIQIV